MAIPDEPVYTDKDGMIDDDCESQYVLHDGTLVMPVMGDSTDTPVVVRLHPPYTMRKSTFSYSRTKSPPVIPTPADTQPNGINSAVGDTYLGGHLTTYAPRTNTNSDLVYTVSGEYNFLVANDVKTYGKVRFDARSFVSITDLLGLVLPPDNETWVSPYLDLNVIASNRILG